MRAAHFPKAADTRASARSRPSYGVTVQSSLRMLACRAVNAKKMMPNEGIHQECFKSARYKHGIRLFTFVSHITYFELSLQRGLNGY